MGVLIVRDALIHRTNNLLEAQLGCEIVALDPEQGLCFGFNETAARVWQMLERPLTLSSLRDSLFDEFEVEKDHCEELLKELLSDLETRGLIKFD